MRVSQSQHCWHLSQIILYCDCSLSCRLFNSISGFCPPDNRSNPNLSYDNKNCLHTLPDVLGCICVGGGGVSPFPLLRICDLWEQGMSALSNWINHLTKRCTERFPGSRTGHTKWAKIISWKCVQLSSGDRYKNKYGDNATMSCGQSVWAYGPKRTSERWQHLAGIHPRRGITGQFRTKHAKW